MKEYRRKFMSNLGTREEAIGAMETQEDDDEEEKDGKQTEGGKKRRGFLQRRQRRREKTNPAFFKGVYPFP
jgi:hypothetical protein